MSSYSTDPTDDFQRLARQYWSAWSEFAQKPDAMPQVPAWKDGLAWWSQLAGQQGQGDVDAALERMNAQAGTWFGSMQQLAAGFAGREADPADIGKAWSAMLGGASGNPMADMFKRMSGADAHGVEAWLAQAQPFISALRGETSAQLGMPAFGLGREQQERLQRLAQAQVAYQERVKDYSAQLARAGKLAYERFERKLGERSEPGRQIDSARALFDLWIDAAEEAWGEVALSPEYCRVYGELVNAQMRLRAGVQGEVELAAGMLGLPTRSEVNASHRKLAALEREVRALKAQLSSASKTRTRPTPEVAAPTSAARKKPALETSAPAAKSKAPTPKPKPKPKPAKTKTKATPRTVAKTRVRSTRSRSIARKSVLPQVVAPRALVRTTPKRKSSAASSAGKIQKRAR